MLSEPTFAIDVKTNKTPDDLAIAKVYKKMYDTKDAEVGADIDEQRLVDGRKPGGAETGHQPELQGGVYLVRWW